MGITNAAKAVVIGAVNAILGLLAAFGIAFSPNTDFKIATITTIVLSAAVYLTRKLSPKWSEDVTNVIDEAAKVTETVAPVVAEVAAVATKKKPAAKATKAVEVKK